MRKFPKRLLAMALMLAMVLSMVSVLAMAEDTQQVILEGSASFASSVAAFSGKEETFTPDTDGTVVIEITDCTPGFYVDVYDNDADEWIDEFYGVAGDPVSFAVTAGVEYRVVLATYDVSNAPFYDAAAGSLSYKFLLEQGGDDQPGDPDDPEDSAGATMDNPKLLTTADWVFYEPGQSVWYLYDNTENMTANQVYSMMLHTHASVEYTVVYNGQNIPVDESGFVNYEMQDTEKQGTYLFCVTNTSDTRAFFSVEVKERPEYVISGINLKTGRNAVTLDPSATYTLYEFTPTQTGVYTFTVNPGLIGDWGIASNPMDHTPDKTPRLQWTCTAVGQSILVGVTNATNTAITVIRTGNYTPPEEIEWTFYDNTYDFSYVIEADAQITDIDLYDGNTHTAVMGEDGFYHYGSAEGPLMVTNLSTIEINIEDASLNGGLRAWLMDENKETISKVDYNEAMLEYLNAGVVPVTPELVTMFTEVGEANGWWEAGGMVFVESLPADMSNPWMQLCGYLVEEPGFTVSGTVTSAQEGEAYVELYNENGVLACTAENGNYAFTDVPAGAYTLAVSKVNHVVRLLAVTVADEDLQLDVKIQLMGDVTGDGKVNMADVAKAFAHVRNKTLITDEYIIACADVVVNGKINMADIARIFAHVKGKTPLF